MQYRWPLDRVSLLQGFGDNPNARGYGPLGHQGIDIRTRYVDCPQGDRTVCAPADGIVQPTIFEANGFGHHVHIRHADGTSTICAHLKSKSVADHAAVTAGQPIGIAGNSGRSSDHHLHFELRNAANQAIDPMPFLDASHIDRMPVDSRYGKPLDWVLKCTCAPSKPWNSLAWFDHCAYPPNAKSTVWPMAAGARPK